MLRIEKEYDGCTTRLRLSGRLQWDLVAGIRAAFEDGCDRRVLDMGDITLVDLEVVRFLIACEDQGVELIDCPIYLREWMRRERAEQVQPGTP